MNLELRPYPAYKPSGVEWLGDVPEHWEVRRLRTVAEMRVSNVDKLTRCDLSVGCSFAPDARVY